MSWWPRGWAPSLSFVTNTTAFTTPRTCHAALLAPSLVGLLAALAPDVAAAAQPPAVEAVGPLRSALDSGKCVDINQATMSDFNNVQLWSCNGGAHQSWYLNMNGELRSAKDSSYCLDGLNEAGRIYTCDGTTEQQWELTDTGELRNLRYGKCLDAASGSSSNGTDLRLYSCNGTPAQRFELARVPWAPVVSGVHSDRCLDVEHESTSKGANVISWDCKGSKNQAWYMTADGELRSGVAADRCLDISGANFQSGTNVQVWECNGSSAQQFELSPSGELRSAAQPSYCVDVQSGSTANGANVQLYACNGTPAQRWSSSSFMQFDLAKVDGSLALVVAEGSTGYALTDPLAVLEIMESLDYSDAQLTEIVDAMSQEQRDALFGATGSSPVAYVNADHAIAAAVAQPALRVNDSWVLDGVLDSSLWDAHGGVSVDEGFAVVHFGGGGAQLSAGAGIVDVSNVYSADLQGSLSLDAGGQTGFSVRLLVVQVDLYFTNPDIGDEIDDIVAFAQDVEDWTDQALADSEDWFEGAAQDVGAWTEGAVDTVGDAFESVFDEISSWF